MSHSYSFQDASESPSSSSITKANPYEAIIEAEQNDPVKISARYKSHRTSRNTQQRASMLSSSFKGVIVDEILAKQFYPEIEPSFTDWRHCLVFWARPTEAIKDLISSIQLQLHEILPNLWLMPSENLHMTALEIAHSLSEAEIETLVKKMLPHAPALANLTLANRARLVKPFLNYDDRAFALSFVPACGEHGRELAADMYTYHHLRRDLFHMAEKTGVEVASRYVVPSAHLTIARFVETTDMQDVDGRLDKSKSELLVEKADEINQWLQREYWPRDGVPIRPGGEWYVGKDKGLEFRRGTLWYGRGERICIGEGF